MQDEGKLHSSSFANYSCELLECYSSPISGTLL